MGLDDDQLYKAFQGLIIIFIIGINIANFTLLILAIFKMKRSQSVPKTKYFILISLAIGDIVLADYSLVVDAITYFDGIDNGSCALAITTLLYESYLIHCVYGEGLIVLSLELVVRYVFQVYLEGVREKFLYIFGLCYGAIPWYFGLIIVVPLRLAVIDSEYCEIRNYTLARAMCTYAVSIFTPAMTAIIFSIFVMVIFKHRNQQPNIQQEIVSGHSDPEATPQNSLQHPPAHPMATDADDPIESELHSLAASPVHFREIHQLDQQNDPNRFHTSQAGQEFQPAGDITQSGEDTQHLIVMEPSTYTDVVKEIKVILGVSIVHFLCVIPFACYQVYHTYVSFYTNAPSLSDDEKIVIMICLWLSRIRSFITPLIWVVVIVCFRQ